MTHDPFKVHRELSCPCCHVKGQVVTNEADGVEFDQGCFADEPYVCCSCGASWLDAGTFVDDALKEYRVQWARIQEGRPYEPPKPKEPVKSKVDLSAFDKLLADAWRKDIEERASRPAFDLSKLKKSAGARWPTIDGLVERAKELASWHRPAEILLPPQVAMPEPPRDAVPGTYRVTKVCQATGTVTVEYEKK